MEIFDYDNILLLPRKCRVDSRSECDTSMALGGRRFKLPVVPANMKTVLDETIARWLAANGYFYVMHRFDLDTVAFAKAMREAGLIVSISAGVKPADYAIVDRLAAEGVGADYVTIDIAHGHAESVRRMIAHLKEKLPQAFVIAGNVGTPEAVIDLETWGADATKVGVGPGKVCITRLKTGFGTGGWQVFGSSPNNRCTVQAAPPIEAMPASDYWSGNWLHVPWAGDQIMMDSPATQLPAPTSGSYPWITKSFWRFSCLASTKNGYPGEGFVAISPEGDKYYFDWVVTKAHSPISKRTGNASGSANSMWEVPSGSAYMDRVVVFFLATRIEDRFGNWVTYTYSGDQLSRIDASDGRYIRVAGVSGGNITSVESSVGTWGYSYSTSALTVTQPDGGKSTYAMVAGGFDIQPPRSAGLLPERTAMPGA